MVVLRVHQAFTTPPIFLLRSANCCALVAGIVFGKAVCTMTAQDV
jgi:hypothetical protein